MLVYVVYLHGRVQDTMEATAAAVAPTLQFCGAASNGGGRLQ